MYESPKLLTVVLAGPASGLLLAGSFPPLDAGYLAWIAPIPALIVIARVRDWQAGMLGTVMGAVFAGLYLYWIRAIAGFPLRAHLLLLLYVAVYYGIFGVALRLLIRRTGAPLALLAPPLWVSLEFARVNAGSLALPGGLLGHTQYENIALIQIASVTSAYGVSFLIVLVNAAIADLILRWQRDDAGRARTWITAEKAIVLVAPLAVGLVYLWGSQQVEAQHDQADPLLKIAAVQANIPQDKKWEHSRRGEILERHLALTRAAARDDPDLIVWPEAAVPGYLRVGAAGSDWVLRLTENIGIPLVVGSATSAKFAAGDSIETELRNSAFLLGRGGEILGKYDKVRLLPFAEYIPLQGRFPWPEWMVRAGDSLVAGRDMALFELDGQPFGVVICWEALFPDPFRELVRGGARFMLNLSNEARFDGTEAGRQFLAMTVFRSVEHRVWLVRAANTGISAAIDPLGVISSRVTDDSGRDLGVRGVMSATITVDGAGTFYTRHGDVFAAACVIMAIALLAFAFAQGKKLRASRPRPLHGLNGRVGHYLGRTSPGSPAVIDRQMTD